MTRWLLALLALAAPAASAAGPFVVTGDDGRKLTLQTDRPLRVISLAPALTEMAAAGRAAIPGPYARLVGVSSFCDFPPAVEKLPRFGGPLDPDYERILAAKPDLVLAMEMMPASAREKLVSLGAPLLFFKEPRTLLEIEGLQARLRGLFGRHCALLNGGAAGGVCGPGMGVYAPDPQLSPERIAPVASCLLLSAGQPLWVAGRGTFLDDLLKVAGCRNAAAEYPGWTAIDLERIAALKPEWIFYLGKPAPRGSPLARLVAAARIKTRVLDENEASRPGPRILLPLRRVESALGTLPPAPQAMPPPGPEIRSRHAP